jgi:recombination protein RecR
MLQDGPLNHLIKILAGLPGLGTRSARRVALHLLSKRRGLMLPLADAIKNAAEHVKECTYCGNLDMRDPCGVCSDVKRDSGKICVVAQVSDLWAIERTGAYKGLYHTLGGLLSAIDGMGPDQLRIEKLKTRAAEPQVEEIILALSATVDGQSTAHYIADELGAQANASRLKITRLAHGVPVGGELDYLDDGTISTAMRARSKA